MFVFNVVKHWEDICLVSYTFVFFVYHLGLLTSYVRINLLCITWLFFDTNNNNLLFKNQLTFLKLSSFWRAFLHLLCLISSYLDDILTGSLISLIIISSLYKAALTYIKINLIFWIENFIKSKNMSLALLICWHSLIKFKSYIT